MSKTLCNRFAVIYLLLLSALIYSGQNKQSTVLIDYNGLTESIDKDAPSLAVNEEAVLAVFVKEVKNLTGSRVYLQYNSTALKYISARGIIPERGSVAFLESQGGKPGPFMAIPGEASDDMASLDIVSGIIGKSNEEAPDGEGVLVYIRFKALKELPQMAIKILKIELSDTDLAVDKIVTE